MKNRRRLSASLLFASLLIALLVPISAVSATRAPSVTAFAGRNVETRATTVPATLTTRAPRPSAAPALGLGEPTAELQVTYHNFSPEAEAAFQAAVDVWETLVVSDCVIHVNATWTPLASGVLGSAGPAGFFKPSGENFVYPAALYEAKTSNCGQAPVEINARFNSAFNKWYLDTDGNPPSTKYDFFSVVMHEIGHGMGVMSSFSVQGGLGYWGFTNGTDVYPLRYDSFEWNAATAGSKMTSFSPFGTTKLKNQLTDGSVFFGGPEVVDALGARLKLYAPSPWSGGSSNSHLDEATYGPGSPESLMTPSLSNGESIHSLGPVTLALLRDIGWETDGGPPPVAPENDNFADVDAVTQTANVSATTDEATLEAGEPVPSCAAGVGRTVWYSFTPGTTRKFSATTAGSNFNTFIAIYTGADLASLVQFKCNDNATGVQTSKIGTQLQAGTTYYFQVGGASGGGGSLVFRVKKA